MKKGAYRTTFSLDEATAKRLRRLAVEWGVSQAEVVRRSVKQAESALSQTRPDPIRLLEQLHEKGRGLNPQEAERRLVNIRQDRESWRGI